MTVQKTDLRPVRVPAPCDACGAALDAGEDVLVICSACRSTVIRGAPGRAGPILSRDGEETALAAEARPAAVPLYQMGQFLGRGAFATVYAARYLPTGEQRAIKFLHAGCPPAQIRRFRRELQLLKRAESPHILKVFELGTLGRHTYIALELVKDGSLRDRLDQGKRLEVPEALEITRRILLGLEVLHQVEIIHRDLKPENVLGGEVKIADLGVAVDLRTQYPDDEPAGSVVGTPLYMAPEQLDGKPGLHSDIYAVGAIMHELLTGIPPRFTRSSTGRGVPLLVPPSQHAPQLNGAVQGLLLSALAWEPKQRPRSAAVFRSALEDLAGHAHTAVIRSREAAASRPPPPRSFDRGASMTGFCILAAFLAMIYGAAERVPFAFLGGCALVVGAAMLSHRAGKLELSRKGVRLVGGVKPLMMTWESCRAVEIDHPGRRFTFRYQNARAGQMETLKVDVQDLGVAPAAFLEALCDASAAACPDVHARATARLRELRGESPPPSLPP